MSKQLVLMESHPEDIGLHEFSLDSLISILERTERTGDVKQIRELTK